MALPYPILSLTLAPADSADRERLHAALSAFSEADPALTVEVNLASCITTVRGESLEQLEALCRRVEEEGHLPLAFASLEVNRLETIRQSAEAEGKYIRQTGGSGNYAHVKLRLEPSEQGKGIEFFDEIKGGVIPPRFIQPIEAGIREAAQAGILAGHPMVDLRATLYDGSFHEMDSNDLAFRIAASQAFQAAARNALPVVLEPVMAVVFTVPESKLSATRAEIRTRRGRVATTSIVRGIAVISAAIPLAAMLRDSGQKTTTMAFDSFQPVSSDQDDAEPSGFAVRNPKGPKPMTGAAAADLNSDRT
jgi:elongation factor G